MSANATRWMPVAGPKAVVSSTGNGPAPITAGPNSYSATPAANASASNGYADVAGSPLTGVGPSTPPGWFPVAQVGNTADRPSFPDGSHAGYLFLDLQVGKLLVWTGLAYCDPATGAVA